MADTGGAGNGASGSDTAAGASSEAMRSFVIHRCRLAVESADGGGVDPAAGGGQEMGDTREASVVVRDGVIERVVLLPDERFDPQSAIPGADVIDATNKLLLPGFFNQHTHSSEMWSRGLIKPAPLELWLCSLIDDSPVHPDAIYDSALLCAAETLLSGGTSIMDHCSMILDMPDQTIDACVRAHRDIGIRAFIAPLMGDLDIMDCMPQEPLRDPVSTPPATPYRCTPDPERRRLFAAALERAAAAHHKPHEGVSIVAGPTGIQLCSDEFFLECKRISEKFGLPRHIHLLETAAQKQLAWDKYGCSAVQHLDKLGFLNEATTCAHAIHLSPHDMEVVAARGCTLVHNPLSNMRLGSGIAPVLEYVRRGINVSFGCDGSASNDAQDLLEAVKMGSILHNLTERDYRKWLTPARAIAMGSEGGARGVGMHTTFGAIRAGLEADLCLYDLKHHTMMPRTDPLGLFVWGRPKEALVHVWVRGRRVVREGRVTTIDMAALLERMEARQAEYRPMHRYRSELRSLLEPKYRAVYSLPL